MPNKHRGEIEARLDGRPHTLCLTLGALAELESAFGDSDMLALAERFSSGRLAATDAIRIIGAGLRGGGADISDDAVKAMQVAGGAAGFVAIVAQLLNVTFGAQSAAAPEPEPARTPRIGKSATGKATSKQKAHVAIAPEEERAPRPPFPGTR